MYSLFNYEIEENGLFSELLIILRINMCLFIIFIYNINSAYLFSMCFTSI